MSHSDEIAQNNFSDLSTLVGLTIKFKHYSSDTFFKGQIVETHDDKLITILPSDVYITCSYFEDDPIAIVFEQNGNISTCQTYISDIDYKSGRVRVKIKQINNFSNRRIQTRYPTSLYATIVGQHEMETSFISNISADGLSLMSNAVLNNGDLIEVETCFKKINFYFKSTVVWSRDLPTIFEYGLSNIACDPDIADIIDMVSQDFVAKKTQMNTNEHK